MYHPFDSTQRKNFVNSESRSPVYEFPKEIESAYSSTIKWLLQLEGMNGFNTQWLKNLDYYNPQNEIENWRGAGQEFSQLLPNHTLKAYALFLQMEQDFYGDVAFHILDQPIISILDNGCGGGSVTAGLILLILKYQKYKLANNLPLFPIKINCFGLEPNLMALQIYKSFIDKCAKGIRKYSIEVDVQIMAGTLPTHIGEINEWLSQQKRLHHLIIGFGNVIRPIRNELEQTQKIEMHKREPDILKDFYYGNYPDNSKEFRDHPSQLP